MEQSNKSEVVHVKKSGITELLNKIKRLEQEVEIKNKRMEQCLIEKKNDGETFKKRINKLEDDLQVNKKAYECYEKSKVANYENKIERLESELKIKSRTADLFTNDLVSFKQQLSVKDVEIQNLKSKLEAAATRSSSQQNEIKKLQEIVKNVSQKCTNETKDDKKALETVKRNLTKLQNKHQKATVELNKYGATPILKEILATQELLAKFEKKVNDTKVLPKNLEKIEEELLMYRATVETRKGLNCKLIDELAGKNITVTRKCGENIDVLETKMKILNREKSDGIQKKLRQLYELAASTTELANKINKDLPKDLEETKKCLQKYEAELIEIKKNSFDQNVNFQKKVYDEILDKLNEEKCLFENLLRAAAERDKETDVLKKNVTGRAEDLFQVTGPSHNSRGAEGSPTKRGRDKSRSKRASKATGWTFDFLDSKDESTVDDSILLINLIEDEEPDIAKVRAIFQSIYCVSVENIEVQRVNVVMNGVRPIKVTLASKEDKETVLANKDFLFDTKYDHVTIYEFYRKV